MATQAISSTIHLATLPELAGGLRYVARQPIMDLRARVHGYELLFRAGPEAVFRGDGNLATRTMLDNTVIYGLERVDRRAAGFCELHQRVADRGSGAYSSAQHDGTGDSGKP